MRALLTVGCDKYDFHGNLSGAELDARRVFDRLMQPDCGDYDAARSSLLLSPSSTELRLALKELLFSGVELDTFTFFFAGHGEVRSGSFYMLCRDSTADGLAFTAFSLADLFLALSESKPLQSNLIIDACEAGGLIADLAVLLKSNLLGDTGTPGVTLVATSAQNEAAGETPAGGFGTNALLDCIEGRRFIQDATSALDLVEIGRNISASLRDTFDQSPVVWGLNLYGPRRFCRNPHFAASPHARLRDILPSWPQGLSQGLSAGHEALWEAYTSVSGDWRPRPFVDAVSAVVAGLADQPDAAAAFCERLEAAVMERAQIADEVFRPAQVAASLSVALLPYAGSAPLLEKANQLLATCASVLVDEMSILLEDLLANKYALLSPRQGGLSELFYLPLRLSNVLAWGAAAVHLLEPSDPLRILASSAFRDVLRLVLRHYSGSIVAMSDAQAPCWGRCVRDRKGAGA